MWNTKNSYRQTKKEWRKITFYRIAKYLPREVQVIYVHEGEGLTVGALEAVPSENIDVIWVVVVDEVVLEEILDDSVDVSPDADDVMLVWDTLIVAVKSVLDESVNVAIGDDIISVKYELVKDVKVVLDESVKVSAVVDDIIPICNELVITIMGDLDGSVDSSAAGDDVMSILDVLDEAAEAEWNDGVEYADIDDPISDCNA